jgi:predicted transcriptional regulator
LPASRKGSVQIRFEILEYLYYNPRPQPITHVWRKATTLSYDDFLKHITYLMEKGYLEKSEEGLSIMKPGRDIYDKLSDALRNLL